MALNEIVYTPCIICMLGVSELEFCNLKSPQFCEFEVISCRKCSFRSKKVFFEVAMMS